MAGLAGPPRIVVGDVQLDLEAGVARRNGTRLKLGAQPFQVLRILLSRPNEVVTREELRTALWPDDVFVDFDHGLNKAINRLRIVLGDSADAPQYIETLPKVGYRWIGGTPTEWKPVVSEEAGPVGWRWNSRWVLAFTLALLAFATLLGGWQFRLGRPRVEFSQRDWVLISQFENRTGNPSLDGSLEALLERELSNSRYVNVVAAERIHDTMRLMRHSMEGRPPLALAREVAVRDGGIKGVIAGKAERIAGRYVFGASLVLPADGTIVSSYTEDASSGDQIVPALRRLSNRVRERLGEDLADIAQSGAALEKATTPSLPALQLFSQSMPYMLSGDWRTAARLLEEALRADPSFATAHVYLAHSYGNLGDPKSAAPHWEEAFRLAGQTTEQERLFILGSYYQSYRVDLKKAVEAYETLVNLYPNHSWALSNLANIYLQLPQEEDPVGRLALYFARAAELRPTDFMTNYRAWEFMVDVPNFPLASVYRERALRALTPEDGVRLSGPVSVLQLGPVMGKVQAGQLAPAVKVLEVAEQKAPDVLPLSDTDYAFVIFRLETALGRNAAAEAWMRRLPPSNERDIQLYYLAWLRGDRRAQNATLRVLPPREWVFIYALAHSGRVTEAERWVPEAERLAHTTTGKLKDRREGLARGEISLRRGDFGAAARQCGETLSNTKQRNASTYWLAADCVATALESQHDLAGAARVLEGVAGPEPVFFARQFWIMSEANRARLYRRLGRDADADRVAQRLQQLLAVADPDHPARALLAAGLKQSSSPPTGTPPPFSAAMRSASLAPPTH